MPEPTGAPRHPTPGGTGLGLGQQVFILYVFVVVLVIGSGVAASIIIGDRLVHQGATDQVESVAHTVAAMPEVEAALQAPDPSAELSPIARRVEADTGILYVVISDRNGVRYTHPEPEAIGRSMRGSVERAQHGEVVVEEVDGRLGTSLRAIVPVTDEDAEVIGLVSAGVQVQQKRDALADVMPLLFGAAAFSLAVAAGGSWWIARRLARQTFGMHKDEVARVYTHHHAVLHAIREGLVVVDTNGNASLINDAARDLLGVGPEAEGRPAAELPVSDDLSELLAAGETVDDRVTLAGEQLVVVSQVPVHGPHGPLGSALTVRDHSEVMALADELSATRSLADGLRAQVHESANRLHTIVMLVELGDTAAAVELATAQVKAKKKLTNRLVSQFGEPTLVALLLGKFAEAERRSVNLTVTDDSRLTGEYPDPVDLVTIVGNLLDNAMDAALAGDNPPTVRAEVRENGKDLFIRVRDSGRGFTPESRERAFEPGWSSKPYDPERAHGRGIGMPLVKQVVTRRGGSILVGNAGERGAANVGDEALSGAVITVRLPLNGDSY